MYYVELSGKNLKGRVSGAEQGRPEGGCAGVTGVYVSHRDGQLHATVTTLHCTGARVLGFRH